MTEDRYIAGVPCWIDTTQPDPQAVAAIGSQHEASPPQAVWNTYIWVGSADETAAKVRGAGGSVLSDPADIGSAGRMAVCADREGAVFYVWRAGEHRGAPSSTSTGR